MKGKVHTAGVVFRERAFLFITVIRTIPFLFAAGFFLILKIRGIFDFETSEESLSLLHDMGTEYFPEFILPVIVIYTVIFYFNHKKIRQKANPVRHLNKNRDPAKAGKMEKARMNRAKQLLFFELKKTVINTLVLLVSAAVITFFIISLVDKNRYEATPLKNISWSLFALFGIGFWTFSRLRNILENSDLWNIMYESFPEKLSGPDLINHGFFRGNEALIRWLDSFWAEPLKINYAQKGSGFALEKEGIQIYLFWDCASSAILYLFIAAMLPEGSRDANGKLKEFTDYIEDRDFDLSLFPEGIYMKGREDRIYSLLKEYREYGGEATMLTDILKRILQSIKKLGGQPGPYYPSFIDE